MSLYPIFSEPSRKCNLVCFINAGYQVSSINVTARDEFLDLEIFIVWPGARFLHLAGLVLILLRYPTAAAACSLQSRAGNDGLQSFHNHGARP